MHAVTRLESTEPPPPWTTNMLEEHRQPFKDIVLRHLSSPLRQAEWKRLRALAADRSRWYIRGLPPQLDCSPAELVDMAISEDALSLVEVLTGGVRAHRTPIGDVAGRPVIYFEGLGIYVWGPEPTYSYTLSIWTTYPAYPPGW